MRYFICLSLFLLFSCGSIQDEINEQFFQAYLHKEGTKLRFLAPFVDVHAKGFGKTPLHIAVIIGDEDLVKVFVERGADLYTSDIDGLTPIQHAIHLYEYSIEDEEMMIQESEEFIFLQKDLEQYKLLQYLIKKANKNRIHVKHNLSLPTVNRRLESFKPYLPDLIITPDSIYVENKAIMATQYILELDNMEAYIPILNKTLTNTNKAPRNIYGVEANQLNLWGYSGMPYKLIYSVIGNCFRAGFHRIYLVALNSRIPEELTSVKYSIRWSIGGGYTLSDLFYLDLSIKVYKNGINVSIDPGMKKRPFWKIINIEEFLIPNINGKYDYQKITHVLTEIINRSWGRQQKDSDNLTSPNHRAQLRKENPHYLRDQESTIHLYGRLDYQTLIKVIEHSHSFLDTSGTIRYLFPDFYFGRLLSDSLQREKERKGIGRIFEENISFEKVGLDDILGSVSSDTSLAIPAD